MAFGHTNEEKMTAAESLEQRRMDLMERQIALQEKQAAALNTQVQRTAPKENPNYIAAGPFTDPQGNPWSKSPPRRREKNNRPTEPVLNLRLRGE